jgi:hypothetical protein
MVSWQADRRWNFRSSYALATTLNEAFSISRLKFFRGNGGFKQNFWPVIVYYRIQAYTGRATAFRQMKRAC